MDSKKIDFNKLDFNNLSKLFDDDKNNTLESDTFEEKLRKMSKSEKQRWHNRVIDTLIETCNEDMK